MVSVLDSLMKECRGLWIAWGSGTADFKVCDSENKVLVPKDPHYLLKRVRLTREDVINYYQGYSNRVLWPLFHLFIEKMIHNKEYWTFYQMVNRTFADAVLEELKPQHDWIWIHDYHLALVPRFIKEASPHAKIAYFWHIPWPPCEIYGALPQRSLLLRGLLCSDFLGFHTSNYVKNFKHCAQNHVDTPISINDNTITLDNHNIVITHVPLGISYDDFSQTRQEHQVMKTATKIKNCNKDKTIILGIDRLDYTKGILDRIKAYEYFLEANPDFNQHVTLVQIATPSRKNIEEYCAMKKEIDEAVGDINSRFGSDDWTPIVYFHRTIPQHTLLAYYQAADIGLITPIRDGMNLIAKEFIATKEEPGVLILSEFAGSTEELQDAIHVNPYDIRETAGAIKLAIEMTPEEKMKRFTSMKQTVKTFNADWWLNTFLTNWEQCYK